MNVLGQFWPVQPLVTSHLLAGDSSKDVLHGLHYRKNKEEKGENDATRTTYDPSVKRALDSFRMLRLLLTPFVY